MREITRWTEPRGREGGANRRRVLLIYRDHREGCIYALRLLRRSIEGGRKVFYLSLSERTEGLMEILRDSMGWVGGEPLKIIGSEEARDYLGTLFETITQKRMMFVILTFLFASWVYKIVISKLVLKG